MKHDALIAAHNRFGAAMERRAKAQFLSAVAQTIRSATFAAMVKEVAGSPYLLPDQMQSLVKVELPLGPLVVVVRDSVIAGGRISGAHSDVVAKANLVFNASHPAVVDFARQQSARMVTGINRRTQEAVRTAIAAALEAGTPPFELAEQLRMSIGLTAGDAQAVNTYRQTLLKQPTLGRARANKMAKDYAARLLTNRAQTIARTEVADAMAGGQELYWKQAVANGDIGGAEREWIATVPSEKTCKVCGGLHGKRASIGGTFPGGIQRPPAHPSCRCTTGLVAAKPPRKGTVWKANPNHDALGRFATGNGHALPKGSTLFHTTRQFRVDQIQENGGFTASRNGESGPGVYFAADRPFADKIRSYDPTMRTVEVRTNRRMRLLDRDTPEGEAEFRELNRDPAQMKQRGYDGVRFTSPGERHPEYVIHDPKDVTVSTIIKANPYHDGKTGRFTFADSKGAKHVYTAGPGVAGLKQGTAPTEAAGKPLSRRQQGQVAWLGVTGTRTYLAERKAGNNHADALHFGREDNVGAAKTQKLRTAVKRGTELEPLSKPSVAVLNSAASFSVGGKLTESGPLPRGRVRLPASLSSTMKNLRTDELELYNMGASSWVRGTHREITKASEKILGIPHTSYTKDIYHLQHTEHAKALVQGIQSSPTRTTYRGMTMRSSELTTIMGANGFAMGIAASSTSKNLATRFSRGEFNVGPRHTPGNREQVLMTIRARAAPVGLAALAHDGGRSVHRVLGAAEEFVIAGRFKIKSAKKNGSTWELDVEEEI